MSVSFPYALVGRAGRLVHVDDVTDDCAPYCPECGGRMIARRGRQIAHHFAHASLVDCASSGETLSHLLGKSILLSGNTIRLPDYISPITSSVCWAGRDESYVDPVLEEKQGDVYRPDAKITVMGERIAVEILVTHTPEDQKIRAFGYMQMPMLEIDCNGIALMPYDVAVLHVLEKAPRRWLSHMALHTSYENSALDAAFTLAENDLAESRHKEKLLDIQRTQEIERARRLRLEALSDRVNRIWRGYLRPDAEKPYAVMSDAEKRCIPRVNGRHSVFACRFASVLGIIRYAKMTGASWHDVFGSLSGRGVIDPIFHNHEACVLILATRKVDVNPERVVRSLFDAL